MTIGLRPRIPVATYRIQLRKEMVLSDVQAVIPYLRALGVSDVYLSPPYAARPGSTHGYDVLDHRELNPELGTRDDLNNLLDALHSAGLGVLLDVVPNHMYVASGGNRYWDDVLENGPSSPFAHYFDIDWNPARAEMAGKVLLPFLDESYGRVLESRLQLTYDGTRFWAEVDAIRLPLAPRTWRQLLEPALVALRTRCGSETSFVLELESILRALAALPSRDIVDPETALERRHELEAIRRRLSSLCDQHRDVVDEIEHVLDSLNVEKDPQTLLRLESVMAAQGFRLANWRVAAHEVNYRRFFDVNGLAALRVEEPDVFDLVHALALEVAAHPAFTGLRIDHVDGLSDPEQYLVDLQRRLRALRPDSDDRAAYVVVEKILGRDEDLPDAWPCAGTTGYEFNQILADLFVHPEGATRLQFLATRFDANGGFADTAYRCRRLVLENTLASELTALALRLDRISQQHRYTRDFTLNHLHAALAETIACFSVYRTYVRRGETVMNAGDRARVQQAVRAARTKTKHIHGSVFGFLESVLIGSEPEGLESHQRRERQEFVTRFQQLTGPVAAKGIEDTAFYQDFPLLALNEVGCDPGHWGAPIDQIHVAQQRRADRNPHGLSATATHDTKRGEDVRARLFAISEVTESWERAVLEWTKLNGHLKTKRAHQEIPDLNEEYFLYQTLVGTWDVYGQTDRADYVNRIRAYMTKARAEAKRQTNWINPDQDYEQAADAFVRAVLDENVSEAFLTSLAAFVRTVARPGLWTGLSQVILRTGSPGVPDMCQGCELWDFSLVDPDNRRPVDFGLRERLLQDVMKNWERNGTAYVDEMRVAAEAEGGRIKMFVLAQALRARRDQAILFERGTYTPAESGGTTGANVFGFLREHEREGALILAGRWFASRSHEDPTGDWWGDGHVTLPQAWRQGRLRDRLTGALCQVDPDGRLNLSQVFAHLPVAWLERLR